LLLLLPTFPLLLPDILLLTLLFLLPLALLFPILLEGLLGCVEGEVFFEELLEGCVDGLVEGCVEGCVDGRLEEDFTLPPFTEDLPLLEFPPEGLDPPPIDLPEAPCDILCASMMGMQKRKPKKRTKQYCMLLNFDLMILLI